MAGSSTSVWIWIIRFLRGILCFFVILSSVYILVKHIVWAFGNINYDYYYDYSYSNYWGNHAAEVLANVPWPLWVTLSAVSTIIFPPSSSRYIICMYIF